MKLVKGDGKMSKPEYEVDIDVGNSGNIVISHKEKFHDGATTLYNAISYLKNTKENYLLQIKQFKNDIKARKEAIESKEYDIGFLDYKLKRMERTLESLKVKGFEPKIEKKELTLESKVENAENNAHK